MAAHDKEDFSCFFEGKGHFAFGELKNNKNHHCLVSVYSMMTRMDKQTRSKFHPYKASQVLGSGADMVLLPPLQPAESTAKLHLHTAAKRHQPTPRAAQIAQAQTNSAALQDNRLLEPRQKCASHNFCHQNWEYI